MKVNELPNLEHDRPQFNKLKDGRQYQSLLSFGPKDPYKEYIIDTTKCHEITIIDTENSQPINQPFPINSIYRGQIIQS